MPRGSYSSRVSLRSEILEQPEVLARLIEAQADAAGRAAGALARREVRWALIAARGSSDNAGLYAKYLWGARNRLPVALAAPSLFTLYDAPPRLDGALVVGISQSGQSPDIVRVLAEARRQGAPTLAITNDPSSPLAAEADFLFDTGTGPERSIAATKTYTAQLAAVALLSVALGGGEAERAALARLADAVGAALALEGAIERAVGRYREMSQCVVLGRGFHYSTAYEWSLKLKELAYVLAEPYSPADFQHGPMAVVSRGFPVLAVVPSGAPFAEMLALLRSLVAERAVDLVALSDRREALELAATPLALPEGVPEWLSPVVAIVPAQLFCLHLARSRGLDVEAPRGLTKVTRTW